MKPENLANLVINSKIQERTEHLEFLEDKYGHPEEMPEGYRASHTRTTQELLLLKQIKKEFQEKLTKKQLQEQIKEHIQ